MRGHSLAEPLPMAEHLGDSAYDALQQTGTIDPLHQFSIKSLLPMHIGSLDISFTNASLWMVLITVSLCLFGHFSTNEKKLVPGRLAYVFESLHNFVASFVAAQLGRSSQFYFPYIYSLFLFVFFANLFGMIPYAFTITSHISVTLVLALVVFLASLVMGIKKNKWAFFHQFCPAGIPFYVVPIIVPIEIISFLSRPFSLAIRLCVNMIAGHVLIKIFAGFIDLLPTSWLLFGVVPLCFNAVFVGFEIIVAALQAYVFTILTCIYLNSTLESH